MYKGTYASYIISEIVLTKVCNLTKPARVLILNRQFILKHKIGTNGNGIVTKE